MRCAARRAGSALRTDGARFTFGPAQHALAARRDYGLRVPRGERELVALGLVVVAMQHGGAHHPLG